MASDKAVENCVVPGGWNRFHDAVLVRGRDNLAETRGDQCKATGISIIAVGYLVEEVGGFKTRYPGDGADDLPMGVVDGRCNDDDRGRR